MVPFASPAVSFEGVGKSFGSFEAIRDVSFTVPAGHRFGLLGSNGAGKTTSIRLLMNIFRPSRGRIEIFGATAGESLKPRLGYLPEERGLYRRMRVQDLLVFLGRVKGRSPAWLAPRIDSWLERLGLSAWRTSRVEALSKGMSQKLQFLAALIHGPELLVLDEPFAGLDPLNRDLLRDAILSLSKEGVTVLFSTHVMEQAEQIVEELVLLHDGEVRLSGDLREIRRREGRQAIHVQYRLREGAQLDGLPGVERITTYGNEAELLLEAGARPDGLLPVVHARAEIQRWEAREPSLHEIFKRVVLGERSP